MSPPARRALARAALLALLLAPAPAARAAEALPAGGLLHTAFGATLEDRLVREGLDRGQVERLLNDPRAAIVEKTLTHAIVYREAKADYSRFLSEERLARAREFIRSYRPVLESAAARYQVPPEITASILMIESNFEKQRPSYHTYPIFNVLMSLVWAGQPENFATVRALVQQRLPEVPAEKIRERAQAKARWGLEQLAYLLRLSAREGTDALALEGSWAGAFGLPQFIPSSCWRYAVDGNGDRRVELFDEADAVCSIGNFLQSFGWKAGLSEEGKRTVLRRYNDSALYVDTVLAAAARLQATAAHP